MRSVSVFIVLLLTSFGTAQDSLKKDGRMWATYGTASQQGVFIKAAYVQGAIEGLRAGAARGYVTGRLDEKNDALNYVKQCVEKGPCATVPIASMIRPESSWNEITTSMDKVAEEYLPHTSVLDIVHQTDKFHSDYKNTPVCMIVAVQESIASLKGKASTEQELEMMRKDCN